jgi:hypothetical protein
MLAGGGAESGTPAAGSDPQPRGVGVLFRVVVRGEAMMMMMMLMMMMMMMVVVVVVTTVIMMLSTMESTTHVRRDRIPSREGSASSSGSLSGVRCW